MVNETQLWIECQVAEEVKDEAGADRAAKIGGQDEG